MYLGPGLSRLTCPPLLPVFRNFVQNFPSTNFNKCPRHLGSKFLRLLRAPDLAPNFLLDVAPPIHSSDSPNELQPCGAHAAAAFRCSVVGHELAVHAHGHATPALEDTQAGALCQTAPRRLPVRERVAQTPRLRVVRADLDAQRTLPDGVKERRRYDIGRYTIAKAEAQESRFG